MIELTEFSGDPENVDSEWYRNTAGFATDKGVHGECYLRIKDVLPDVIVDLKYATTDNFAHRVLYTREYLDYLLDIALYKFVKAYKLLQEQHPHYTFVIWDALRPRAVQCQLFDLVKNTIYEQYVSDPKVISMHNFGVAVDISLWDKRTNSLVDMGSKFDEFSELSEPRYETRLLSEGKLTQLQIDNRRCLRSVMCSAGFYHINFEWWHFNAIRYEEAIAGLSPLQV